MRKSFLKPKGLSFLLFSVLIILILLTYIYVILKPSHDRNWEPGTEKLPQVSIENNLVMIHNMRDFKFEPGKIVSENYTAGTFDVNKISKVWFLVEPFDKFDGIAHTYFIFDFKDGQPIAISVESRRESGEGFSPFIGLLNQYELMYIWGTEIDATVRRVLIEDNKVYMYPLNISELDRKNLFLQLAKSTQEIQNKPRFYNTLLSNFTNELAKAANKVKPNSIPFNIALFLPGYSANELYKSGFIPGDLPPDQLKEKAFISDFVKANYQDPQFSEKLRHFFRLKSR